MPVETAIKVAGVWELLTAPEVKVAGVWEAVTTIEVKVGGVWELVFDLGGGGGSVAVTNILIDTVVSSSSCFSGIEFVDDGSINQQSPTSAVYDQTHAGEWWTAEPEASVGADYEVRCQSIDSGSAFLNSGAAVGVWTDFVVTDSGQWSQQRNIKSGVGVTETVATFQIRLKASPFTVLDTFEVHLRCERTA